MSRLQALIANCGKPLLAIGLPTDDVGRALREQRVAWLAIYPTVDGERTRIVFMGDKPPDLVFPKPIPDSRRDPIEEPDWVKPDDVLASIGTE